MKRSFSIAVLLAVGMNMFAAKQYLDSCMLQIQNGDTMYMAWLHEVWVYPPMKFKNKKQEKFYWRTVRDVKKCLPYAKMITKDMAYADAELAKLPDNKARKKWWHSFERELYKKYEKDFRGMYASQGMMLMLLLDRETDRTSYDLIKQYKGKASANFWQFVAKLFKNDLKEEYDASDKDRITERVINLVEAGQL
ncbi:MAG: DUF4294 domain-containing protein [Paludibacteraceae bacterium]|nr:DUF4294 domain-containing protein [Paludibacteraceae bacterium]